MGIKQYCRGAGRSGRLAEYPRMRAVNVQQTDTLKA